MSRPEHAAQAHDIDPLALHLDLFQIQVDAGKLQIVSGIAVKEVTERGFFVADATFLDPQNDYGHPLASTADENLVLEVDEQLAAKITPEGRIVSGSLVVIDGDDYDFREPFGVDKLHPPVQRPIGSAALVGIAERQDLTLVNIAAGLFRGRETRELDVAQMRHDEERARYKARLILLTSSGHIQVASDIGSALRVHTLYYDPAEHRIVVEDVDGGSDSGQGFGGGPGPDSNDRQPRGPVTPAGSAAAAVEPPHEEEQPLQLIGKEQ
jgi:hypothetical protein